VSTNQYLKKLINLSSLNRAVDDAVVRRNADCLCHYPLALRPTLLLIM
jgi:hypothetical protein